MVQRKVVISKKDIPSEYENAAFTGVFFIIWAVVIMLII